MAFQGNHGLSIRKAAMGEPKPGNIQFSTHKEKQMKKILTSAMVFTLALTFGVGSVMAGDRTKDRKRNGSCQSSITTETNTHSLAAIKKRDKKRDGSCTSITPAAMDSMTLAGDRTKDRKRNGTCSS
jgi:hypothetical protein